MVGITRSKVIRIFGGGYTVNPAEYPGALAESSTPWRAWLDDLMNFWVGWKWLESYHETLVGGIPAPLKNMKVSWDYEIPNIWNNKKCSKPPTRT